MNKQNDYYAIAYNDLQYLQHTLDLPYYNQIAIQAQLVAEELLKSVAERACLCMMNLIRSHNLQDICAEIHTNVKSFIIDNNALSLLDDIYHNARYPGDNFVILDKESCNECIHTMYDVIKAVNQFRKELSLDCFEYQEIYISDSSLGEINSFR